MENLPEREVSKGSTLAKTFKENKKLFIGTAIIFGCGVLAMLAGVLYINISSTNKFKNQLDSFLVEAERISVMTEQGVIYQEFRSQYYEVKAAYSLIDYWPRSYQDSKRSFDLALEGWELTLDIWELGIKDRSIDFDMPVSFYFNDSLINYWSLYVGIDLDKGGAMTTRDWIGELMLRASRYYKAGKAGAK